MNSLLLEIRTLLLPLYLLTNHNTIFTRTRCPIPLVTKIQPDDILLLSAPGKLLFKSAKICNLSFFLRYFASHMQQQRFFCIVGYHFVHAWLLDRLCLSYGKYVLVTQSLISNTWPDASKEITVGTQISLIS